MNFYRHRPLAFLISLSTIIYILAAYIDGTAKIILSAAIIVLLLVLFCVSHKVKDFRICGTPYRVFAILGTVILIFTLFTSYTYYDIYEKSYRSLTQYEGDSEISAKIIAVESGGSYNATYKINTISINGIKCRGTGLVYTETSTKLPIGSVIKFSAKFTDMEDFYTYRGNSRTRLLADGCVFTCKMTDYAEEIGTSNDIFITLNKLRTDMSKKLSLYLDRDSAALSTALLLGDSSSLGRIYRDFSYIGVLHILALSGTHIVIIGGALEKFLMLLRCPAILRHTLIAAFMILYMAVTGFSPSIVRAVIMLLITYISSIFRRDNDKITSLFIACGIIVAASPPSVYDVGLQLSFFATLGVLLMTEDVNKNIKSAKIRDGKFGKIVYKNRKILLDISASLGAVMFVIPLQWLYFGEMSLLSVLATLILSPILNLLLTILLPYMLFALMSATDICRVFAVAITFICRICEIIARWLASFSPLISLKYPFASVIIIGFVVVIIVMMIKNVRRWYMALIPFFASMLLILGCREIYGIMKNDTPIIEYRAVKSHDMLLAISGGKSVLIDFSDGSGYAFGAMGEMLSDNYCTHADKLFFTKLSARHVSALSALISRRIITQIFTPIPKSEAEVTLIDSLYRVAKEYDTEVILYDRSGETVFSVKNLEITLPAETKISRSSRVLPAAKFTSDSVCLSYVGMSAWESDYIKDFTAGSKFVIFGVNGPVFKGYDGGVISENTKAVYTADESLAKKLLANTAENPLPIIVDDSIHIVIK